MLQSIWYPDAHFESRYGPFKGFGQFFHRMCIQSTAPRQPGNPKALYFLSIHIISAWIGIRFRISCAYILWTASMNAVSACLRDSLDILHESSNCSYEVPSAIRRKAQSIFCQGGAPRFPAAALFCRSSGRISGRSISKLRNSFRGILNRFLNSKAP